MTKDEQLSFHNNIHTMSRLNYIFGMIALIDNYVASEFVDAPSFARISCRTCIFCA